MYKYSVVSAQIRTHADTSYQIPGETPKALSSPALRTDLFLKLQ